MSVSTTIYINENLLNKFEVYSQRSGISVNSLIQQVLIKAIRKYEKKYREYRLTEYQKNSGGYCFIPYHVRFSEEDAEQFQFARYELKISVSKLVFLGFLLFIEDVLKSLIKGEKTCQEIYDSYYNYFKNYNFLIENFNITLKKRE